VLFEPAYAQDSTAFLGDQEGVSLHTFVIEVACLGQPNDFREIRPVGFPNEHGPYYTTVRGQKQRDAGFSLTSKEGYCISLRVNGPLALTYLRILAVPILVVVLLSDFRGNHIAAFAVFVLATFTDTLDGFWARRKKQITVLGQLLDPTADKLLVVSALICLVGSGAVPEWMAVIIIGREIAVTGFRALASAKGIHIPASWLGKVKMILETTTIGILLLGEEVLGGLYVLSKAGLWLTVLAALVSAGEYYIRYGRAVLSGHS
jgi:CDP-diacylglycerol--glycerol-3-phosphate 3-phosphatidyltransferase